MAGEIQDGVLYTVKLKKDVTVNGYVLRARNTHHMLGKRLKEIVADVATYEKAA